MDNFSTALNRSSAAFNKHYRSKIEQQFNVTIEPTENLQNNKIAFMLDAEAGIDYLLHGEDFGVCGLASRIQFGSNNWAGFTIRRQRDSGAKTEFEKLCHAIEKGRIYPHLICHGYIDGNNSLGCALTRTSSVALR